MSLIHKVRREEQKHAERRCAGGTMSHGGRVKRARGGSVEHPDEAEDKKLIKKELRSAKIEPKKRGGEVKGEEAHKRLDKRARGGATKGHHAGVKINIHAGGGGGNPQEAMAAHQAGMQQGAKMGAQAAIQRLAGPGGPKPPMAPPGPVGPPPSAPPPQAMPGGPAPMGGARPPMMAARGGKVFHDTEFASGEKYGARGGMGREAAEGITPPKIAKGGRVVEVRKHHRHIGGAV